MQPAVGCWQPGGLQQYPVEQISVAPEPGLLQQSSAGLALPELLGARSVLEAGPSFFTTGIGVQPATAPAFLTFTSTGFQVILCSDTTEASFLCIAFARADSRTQGFQNASLAPPVEAMQLNGRSRSGFLAHAAFTAGALDSRAHAYCPQRWQGLWRFGRLAARRTSRSTFAHRLLFLSPRLNLLHSAWVTTNNICSISFP